MSNFTTRVCVTLLMGAAATIPSIHAIDYGSGMRKLSCSPTEILTYNVGDDSFTVQRNQQKPPFKIEPQGELILSESFSHFEAGSEENPDGTMIPEDYLTENNPMIPDKYTETPGWWGMGIYQAGGTCFLGYPDYGGVITTPPHNLNGKIRISFRAKASNQTDERGSVLILCMLKGDAYNPSMINDVKKIVNLTSEWAEYSFTFDVEYTGNDACVQFNGVTYDKGKYIDDIRIERLGYILSTPKANDATEYTGDSFVANWQTQGATNNYQLSAFTTYVPEGEDVSAEQHFNEGTELPANFSGNNIKVAPIEGDEDDLAIEFGTASQLIIENNGGVFRDFIYKFWMQINTDYDYETPVYVDGWNGTSWETITISTVHNRDSKPDQIVNLGWLEDMYPGFFRFRNLYTKIRITVPEEEGYRFYFDDLEMVSSQPVKTIYACNETPVNGNSYKVTGIDPEDDYSYMVRAVDGDNISGWSNLVKVYQLTKPETMDATDVDPRGGFTANWNRVPKAEQYQTICYRITDITADDESYPLLTETFAKATKDGYTLDEPYVVGNDYEYESLDDQADNIGWKGIGLIYADNMVGCGEDHGLNQLESPVFDASHNNGRFIVTFKCYGTPGEMLTVQNAEISYQFVTIREGINEYSVTFDDGTENSCLVMYAMNGTPFLIGDIKVTQSMKAGEQIRTCLEESPWIEETEYHFSNMVVDGSEKIGYTVQARYNREFAWYYSPVSEVRYTSIHGSVNEINDNNSTIITVNGNQLSVVASDDTIVEVYALDGYTVAIFSGERQITLPKGFYVVKAGETIRKIDIDY